MTSSPSGRLRVAIGQLQMQWTAEANTRAIVDAIALAAGAGAQLCVFPELAVTGFHREIRAAARPERVAPWLAAIRAACAGNRLSAVVGAPTFGDDGGIFNSAMFIDAAGSEVGVIEKIGITLAEATFFAPGRIRPVFVLAQRRCSAVICREIDDFEEVGRQLPPGTCDLLLWPGAMRPAVDGSETDPDAHIKRAQTLARISRAFIVQANWPNSLNYPGESAEAGQSAVIDPTGALLLRLPIAQPGVGVFDLGQAAFDWYPQSGWTIAGPTTVAV